MSRIPTDIESIPDLNTAKKIIANLETELAQTDQDKEKLCSDYETLIRSRGAIKPDDCSKLKTLIAEKQKAGLTPKQARDAALVQMDHDKANGTW